ERVDLDVLLVEIILQDGQCVPLWGAGRCDRRGEDEPRVEVCRDVTLVSAERIAVALATVAHLSVLDRYPPTRCNPVDDSRHLGDRCFLDVLPADLAKRREMRGHLWQEVIGNVALD